MPISRFLCTAGFCFSLVVGYPTFGLFLPSTLQAQEKGTKPNAKEDDEDEDEDEVDVDALMKKGQAAIAQKKYAVGAEAFEQVVEEEPDNSLAWQLLGYCQHLVGDLDKAIVAHSKACEFDDTKQLGFYNLGCAYALKKETDKAFEALNKAVSVGFLQMQYFDTDTDLDSLRKDERFAKIIARVKNGGQEPFDVANMVGEWTFESGKKSGETIPAERMAGVAKFTKEKVTLPAGPDAQFVMKFKVNTEKKLTTIDLEIESGPAPEGKALGIIKIQDDKMTLCYDPNAAKRPSKFESTAENGCFLFVLKKKAEK